MKDSTADGFNPVVSDRRRPWSVRRPANPHVSVIVPAMNEAQNVREILPKLGDYYEVIVVDGHSTDGTVAAAKEALPKARVIQQTRTGKGNALACGFREATGEVIVMFDADGSADPAEIRRFVNTLTVGADLAKGSRFLPGGGSEDITGLRRLGNSVLNSLASILTGYKLTDLCYGFNAFWADNLYLLDLPALTSRPSEPKMQRGDGFEIEALIIGRFALANAKIVEVPSFERHRLHGQSNLRAIVDGLRILETLLHDRLYARRTWKLAHRRVATRRATVRHAATPMPAWVRSYGQGGCADKIPNPRTMAAPAHRGP